MRGKPGFSLRVFSAWQMANVDASENTVRLYSATHLMHLSKSTLMTCVVSFSVFFNFLSCFSLIGGPDYKLIYRHYATLYFVFCVDSSESELGILDLIQVFVETLDKCFENVCELDLIFHMDKVKNRS